MAELDHYDVLIIGSGGSAPASQHGLRSGGEPTHPERVFRTHRP